MSGETWAIAAAAAAIGVLGGLAVALWKRPQIASGRATDAAAIGAQLEVQAAELRRLADQASQRELSADQLRAGLESARGALDELRVRDQERRSVDAEQRHVVQRLATVLAGGASKGRSGELILREHLSELPPGMLVSDFRVNGKVVEFGLLLPDGRRLPIDSKWTAVTELEELEACSDAVERDACARAVERAVVARAKEVAQYLDPAITAPVAVAAIPDAAYGALKRAHADAYGKGVVIVPYSSALPIVLFLYSLVRRYGDAADIQAGIEELAGAVDVMESVVENKVVRAATMLTNGADELRTQLGRARGTLARAQAAAPEPSEGGPALQIIG